MLKIKFYGIIGKLYANQIRIESGLRKVSDPDENMCSTSDTRLDAWDWIQIKIQVGSGPKKFGKCYTTLHIYGSFAITRIVYKYYRFLSIVGLSLLVLRTN